MRVRRARDGLGEQNFGPPVPLQTEFSRFCDMKYLLEKETHNKKEESTLKELRLRHVAITYSTLRSEEDGISHMIKKI